MLPISGAILRKAGTFVLSFGLSKIAAFTAALALPRFVDIETYGLLELAMSIASLGAGVLGLGAPAFAARAHLLEDDPSATTMLVGHAMVLSLLGSGLGLVLLFTGASNLFVICAGLLALFGVQSSASSYVRMHGNVALAGWFDAIALIAVVALAVSLSLVRLATAQYVAIGMLAIALAILIPTLRMTFRVPMQSLKLLLQQVVLNGTPMMLYGLSIILLFGTSRMAIGRGLGLADVAVFSVCARLTAMLLFANQIFQIGFIQYLYRLKGDAIARIFPYWTMALCAAALMLALVGYFSSELIVAGTSIPASAVAKVFPSAVVLSTLSILNANIELYINRELASRQAAVALTVISVVGFVVGIILLRLDVLNLASVVDLYSVAMGVALVVQMRILVRHGLSFGWSYLVLPMVVLPWFVHFLPAWP